MSIFLQLSERVELYCPPNSFRDIPINIEIARVDGKDAKVLALGTVITLRASLLGMLIEEKDGPPSGVTKLLQKAPRVPHAPPVESSTAIWSRCVAFSFPP